MDHRLVRRDSFHVLGLEGRFTPATTKDIAALWGRFAPQMHDVPERVGSASYGVCRATQAAPGEAHAFHYAACVEVASLRQIPEGWVGFTIPANLYAVFTHRGYIHDIGATIQGIWTQGLKAAGLEALSTPDFEVYDERWDARTGLGDVDIYIPVRPPSDAAPAV